MPTGARGEGILELDGESYPVLFTNRALAEAERALDTTVLRLAKATRDGDLGMNSLAALLRIGLEYARRERRENRAPYKVEDAYRLLDTLGYPGVTAVVMEAFMAVLSYSPSQSNDSPPA